MQNRYDLKLENGTVVQWEGVDGIDAGKRYADACGGTVIAWRETELHGIHVYSGGPTT